MADLEGIDARLRQVEISVAELRVQQTAASEQRNKIATDVQVHFAKIEDGLAEVSQAVREDATRTATYSTIARWFWVVAGGALTLFFSQLWEWARRIGQ